MRAEKWNFKYIRYLKLNMERNEGRAFWVKNLINAPLLIVKDEN